METTGSCVAEWDDESQQCCIPIEWLQRALLIVTPPPSELRSADASWLLIPLQGKKSFGMDYSVDDANDEEDDIRAFDNACTVVQGGMADQLADNIVM